LVDHALRRRFAFLPLYPNYEGLNLYHRSHNPTFPVAKLAQLLKRVNGQINDRNYSIGTTFFLHEDLPESISSIWRMEIEPYLEEYFFDQWETIEQFRWTVVQNELMS
jgi:5-methylcytosine-specific restriction enzyme B